MESKFNELVVKLKEIFQLDKPELDFGVYRIMHTRAKEITDFLENRLAQKVKDALSGNTVAEKKLLEDKLASAIEGAKKLGVNPDDTPTVKELRERISAFGFDGEEESIVYSHLLTFFSRYYDDGDFISKRRYKDGLYAIPYSGEEVKLHWANADQYYIKSGESFQNYSFMLDGGKRVNFKLVTAETAKDNIKDNDAIRCFVLWDPEEAKKVEDEEIAAELPDRILEEKDGELYIYFQYRKFKKGTKQSDFAIAAREKIFAELGTQQLVGKYALAAIAPTEKDKKRTVFDKHFTTYTAKNTSDYFIHKDLKGFLTRELDFYIKNEMMHLDDIQNVGAFKEIEKNLRQIQAVRTIASELITFMAQLEDFQKKLWLKKKFVTQCDYCLTMDRIPESLHAEVFANEKQQAEWKKLGFPTGKLTSDGKKKQGDLFKNEKTPQAIDARMVDTKFFGEEFKAKLLRSIPDLDEQCDGVLIHSENFQALGFLSEKLSGRVDYCYIDPPYNSKTSRILYKNDYLHASWLSLIHNRLMRARPLLKGPLTVAIDENEQEYLGTLLSEAMPENEKICICVVHNKKGIQGDYFSTCHEYAYFSIPKTIESLHGRKIAKKDWEYNNLRKWGSESDRSTAKNCFYPIYIKEGVIIGFGDVCSPDEHPDCANVQKEDGSVAVYPIETSSGKEKKWRYARDTIESIAYLLKVIQTRTGELQIHKAVDVATLKTLWNESRYIAGDFGTKWLSDLDIKVADNLFPKSLFTVEDSILACTNEDSLVLDYFGGSGTTAHAVIATNRDHGGNRRYCLVEMGDHYNSVILPRLKKIVYSPDWKDGSPVESTKGISHCFKYMTLESYEDALNNIELEDKHSLLSGAMSDEFLLGYMLDVEAKGSIINTDDFRHPFDYMLKIAVDSSGASEKRKIDLVETFNYLIGLKVAQYVREIEKGYVFLDGVLPNGEKAFVLWRDCEKVNNDELNKLLVKLNIKPGTSEYDVIYLNGDHAVQQKAVAIGDDEAKKIKVKQIESVFLEKMFEEC